MKLSSQSFARLILLTIPDHISSPELDRRFMKAAISMGRRGLGLTWPNPSVGCVITRGARILSRAVTAPGGRPHAETQALAKIDPRGATAYVTLEPCAHQGETPPCAKALINSGIARVVIAITDPDPRVAGRGIKMLRDAGINVTTGVLADEATQLHEGFLSRIKSGRPHLTLKLASSLDGRIAMPSGESRWITGPDARHYVHRLRAISDGILIGSGTAIADDPMLDVRPQGPKPVRIVLDRELKLPPTSRLMKTSDQQPLWLLHAEKQPKALSSAKLLQIPMDGTKLDLKTALQTLGDQGLTQILCEGGGTLAASLIESGLVDRLITFTAGLGLGSEAIPNIGPLSTKKLADAPRFKLQSTRRIGADTLSIWAPQ